MITSPQNPKLKHIRQLNTSKQYRKTHRQFVFENERWIKEALQNQSHHIDYLVCTQAHSNLLQLANSLHITTYTCDDRCAQSIAHAKHAAGCFLVLGQPTFNLPASTQHMALGLYNIQNPANLVEGVANEGWIRGGLPSRELTRDMDYFNRKNGKCM